MTKHDHEHVPLPGPHVTKHAFKVGEERGSEVSPRTKRAAGSPDIHIERAPASEPSSASFTVPDNYDPSKDGCYVALKTGTDKFWLFARRLAVEEFKRRRKAGEPDLNLLDVMEVINVWHGPNKGKALTPNKGLLLSAFGTDDTDAVATKILAEGHIE